jgi:ubiquinol-cytochrome c reductase iron-sulfur subunit
VSEINNERRKFLATATTISGVAGISMFATPFLASFKPSVRAQALGAPVEVDISNLEPGSIVKVEWRGRAVMVVHRTVEMLDSLNKVEPLLSDPQSEASVQPSYALNEYRSLRPEILVVEGVCTHLGCAPTPRFEVSPQDLGADWQGGFYCPCHGSKFDLSGRVYSGVPAPTNLSIPPYGFLDNQRLIIGQEAQTAEA